ncbi:MAG: hypothetical protein ACPGTU_09920 [Myxococcota bacterium]
MLTRRLPHSAMHSLALFSFALLALWQMSPVLEDPTRLAIGFEKNDVWNHIWGYGFVTQSLAVGEWPMHTDLLNWPDGGTLWFIDFMGALMSFPVSHGWGSVAGYNVAMGFNWWLCGAATYALAWRVTRSGAGAWAAAIAFQTMPHLLGQAYNGISETMAAGWLPLAILTMREMVHKPSRKNAVLAGVTLGLCALANWYYGVFAGLAFIGLILREAWKHRGRLPSQTVPLGVLFLGSTVVIVAPALTAFAASMSAVDAIVTRDETFVWATLVLHNMTDLVSFFRPGKFYSPDLKALFGEDLLAIVYLGHALVWPAFFGLFSDLRRRMKSWGWLTLGYFVLALGPFLYVGGDYLQVLGGWIPLPFLALFKWLPMFSRISHAYRFTVGITLGLCILLAWSIRAMQSRGMNPWVVALLLGSLRIGEAFYASPAVFPLPTSNASVPAVFAELKGGAVLDLPVGQPVLARSRYSLAQLVHGQPSPYGLNDPLPMGLRTNRFLRFLVEMEYSTVATMPAQMPWFDLIIGRTAAVDDGLKWIVLHESSYPRGGFARTSRFLDMVATPIHQGDGVRIYRLDP